MASDTTNLIEWPEFTLGELVAFGDADFQTGPFGTMLHAKAYQRTGVPVVAVKNIGDNRLIDHEIPRVDENSATRLGRYRLKVGDIVFGRKGAVERRALVGCAEDGWLQGSDCIRLRLNPERIDPRFVSFVLGSQKYRAWIAQQAHGATMPSLNQEILSRIPLPIPPLREQRSIAAMLGNLDDKIEMNRRMNETLEAMARALFKSWFVDFDPVRAKAERRPTGLPDSIAALFPDSFEDSELGEIPKGWSVQTLGNLTGRVSMGPFGSDIKTSNFTTEGVPVIRGKNLVQGFIDKDFVYVSEEKADALRNAIARTGDIVITHRGTLGQVGIIPEDSRFPRYVVSQSQMVLSADKRVSTSYFLYYFLISDSGRHQLLSNTSQTGVPAIGRPTLSVKSIKLSLCARLEILRAFEMTTATLAKRINLNSSHCRTLSTVRDALLPKLISGEIRIKDAERLVEASV